MPDKKKKEEEYASFLSLINAPQASVVEEEQVEEVPISPDQTQLFQEASQIQLKPDVPWYKSLPSAALRGLAEGTIRFSQGLGPLEARPGEVERAKLEREKLFEKILPMEEGVVETGLQKAGAAFPMIATAGTTAGGALLRSLLSGVAGTAAKEGGIGELGQAIIEGGAAMGPDLRRIIPTTAKQAPLADFARRMKMSEEELALTLGQRGASRDFFTDVASKGGRTVRAFDATKAALGRVWDTLRSSPEAQKTLGAPETRELVRSLSTRLGKLPAEQRNRVMSDYNDLISSSMKGDDIINFWQDLNYYIQRGERGVGVLKEDLQKAIEKISPQLGQDFKFTNDLYGKFSDLSSRMGPNLAEHFIRSGEKGLVLSAVTTGNYPLLQKLIGPVGGRLLAREMIINPRLQNLSKRMFSGILQGLPAASQKIYDELILEVGKVSPEAAGAMSQFDVEEFVKTIPKEEKRSEE